MNISEVALITSGLALIGVENQRFIADLADVAKECLQNASNMDLILLTKGSHYMRKYEHSHDLYARVHAECVSRLHLRKLEDQERDILSQMFTKDAVMKDSPFLRNL